MALSLIQFLPSERRELNQWTFNHQAEHLIIINAVAKKKGTQFNNYIVDPFTAHDPAGWLNRHQQLHNDMNGALNFPGNDLETVDLKNQEQRLAWSWLHFQEHLNAIIQLGIRD